MRWFPRFGQKNASRDFELHHKIGHGTYASVYKCTFQGKTCAAKIVNTSRLPKADTVLLANEMKIWLSLSHANLVPLFRCIHEPTRCVMICELLEGGTLAERHQRLIQLQTTPNILTILNGAAQLVAAMSYMHNTGFLHRDIKTENIFLNTNHDVYKIGDFGLAREVDADVMTAETGSYRYMAPEVIRHETYGPACDVYSFAMVLYEMLTLKVPFAHCTPIDAALGVACRGERPAMPTTPDDVAVLVAVLVTDCWDQAASKRPTSPEIATRLRSLLQLFS